MKNKALLWINAILFYDLRNLIDTRSSKQKHIDWLNGREPLSKRIKEYNEKHNDR